MRLTVKMAVWIDCSILVGLIISRMIYSLITGYLLPDEGWYCETFVVQHIGFSVYRPIMNLAYVVFFSGTSSITELFVRGAIYCGVFAIGSIYLLSKVLKELEIPEQPAALTILSFMVLPIFPLMSVFFVTETMALFFGLTGIFFCLKYFNQGKALNAALAALMFLFASEVREPYILFVLVTPLILFAIRWNLKSFLSYCAIALIAAPLPISIVPVNLSQPVSTFLFQYLPDYISASLSHGVGSTATTVVQFPSYVYVSGTTLSIGAGAPSAFAFLIGGLYGIGPIFGCLIAASLYFTIKAKSYLVLLFSILGIISFFSTADLTVAFTSNAASVWTSDLIRLSSAALPAGIGLAYLYTKLSKFATRAVLTSIALTFVIGIVFVGSFSSAIQSTQNVQGSGINRISLSYRSPYFMMYQIAQPGSLVISGESGINEISVFTSFKDNVTVYPIPANPLSFKALISEGWTSVYLYDDWVPLNASFINACGCYPQYYSQLVLTLSNSTLLWSNGESYALELNQH